MSSDSDVSDAASLEGRPVDEVVDQLVETRDAEADTVRAALGYVSDDGVVSREAAQDSLAHVSKVVSTPETRVELARMELSEAREKASGVADLDVVAARLSRFETQVERVEERAAALGPRLQRLVERQERDGDLFEIGREIRQLTTDANEVQRDADDLMLAIEDGFGKWLASNAVRVRELREDVDALDASHDELAASVETLVDFATGESDDPPDGSERVSDPALAWATISQQLAVHDLLAADVRAELEGIRTWKAREDIEGDGSLDDLEPTLDRLAERRTRLRERLADVARDEWVEQYGDQVDAVETKLAAFDPPTSWETVQTAVDRHGVTPTDSA
ncbi:hypothetical protein SAMN04487949_3022 [Halogranum gelatinilyticum]|uniref:Halo transducer protein n=1 Tax=Halogranum gelatinilyticum TaxID=660521 RepID=A0A1G9XJM9_9EURY|nr:halo transducer protein [Halogranum gelatinilyticum]SDM97032.1 hypothetical protein SAMN04487949_3022 [Halogranum gelatinilyticum]